MAKIHEGEVYLEPIEHIYIHRKTGKQFTSVTKVLGSIEPHFEGDRIAENIAKQSDTNPRKNPVYIGMTKEQILDHWQMLNDTANEYGTKVHETIEKYLLSNKMLLTDDPFEIKVIKAYNELGVDEGIEIYPERVMFSEEYELAGTADLKIDINEEFFDIGDWKTNKEFNFYDNFGFKTLLKPFDHMQNCQYSIYSMQLSVYALMCEMETGMKCRQIWIGYWNKETESFTKIPVMYLKSEAKKLLDIHKFNTLSK